MNLQVIKNRIRKILAYTVTGILFLFISAFLILQIPPVQNRLVGGYLKSFSQIIGFKTHINRFHMLWFDRLELEGVSVYDPANNKMFGVKKILINFKLLNLLRQKDVDIDGVSIDSAHVFLTKIQESDTSRNLNINVFINQINEKFSSGSGGNPAKINIGEAVVNQSQFTYVNQDHDSIKMGFDYDHFSLDVDEGLLQNFSIIGDTTQFNVRTLLLEDHATKFKVKQLSTFFRLSQLSMEFVGLDLKAGQSTISDTVLFNYKRQRDLDDIVDKVKIHANLHNTVIYPKDLALFAPGVERLDKPLQLDGIFNGRVNKFKFTNMKVGFGRTTLMGSLDMDGLPNFNETFIILNLKNSNIQFDDFSFLFNDQTMASLHPIGKLDLNGQFLGYPTDFVANGNFSGKLGRIKSDINFKVNEESFNKSSYRGRLAMIDFDLGTYLKDTINFQKVNLEGKISGSGLSQATADFILDGNIRSVGIKGYNYSNIFTNARFASEFFSGVISINDPNLQFKAQGSIDLHEKRNFIKIKGSLDTLLLHNLKLSKRKVFIQTDLDINIRGLRIDSLTGTANFKDFSINFDDEWLRLKNIDLNSKRDGEKRSLNLETSLVDANMNGNFNFTDISRDIQILLKEISLNVKNDKQAITNYYQVKSRKPKSYEAAFNIALKNIKPLTDVFDLDMKLSRNTIIEGKFSSGYTTIFQAFTRMDSVDYNGSSFSKTDAEITISKIADSTNVLAMAYINSKQQYFGPNFKTKDLTAEGIWNKSHIDFGLDADQDGLDNYLRLKGAVDFMKDSTQLTLQPSAIKVLDQVWKFDLDNRVVMFNKEFKFSDVKIINAEQSIALDGRISADPHQNLSLKINQFELAILNAVSGKKISGILNAEASLSDYYNNPSLENDVFINKLAINDFLIGDITGKNQWEPVAKQFDINFFIDRLNSRIVNFAGFYNPSNRESPLDIKAQFENANLKIIEPFFDYIFSQLGGTVTGDFHIGGKLKEPIIEGEGRVADGQLMVNYLKTLYSFTGVIGMTRSSIDFKNIDLVDASKNTAKLNGSVNHHNFFDTRIDIDVRFRNFQLLNTSAKDNSLFYGQGYATGNVNFAGPVSNLKITATAKTEKNTRVYIPIGGTSSVEKKEFINFVNFSDTTFIKDLSKEFNNKIDLTGLSFDLNLDITPDAYCEIIFDIKSGDIIRGRGNGDLQLQLDTKGEFNMYGPFEFTEGWYNFTLYDIINKEFQIQKGSSITWYGDPYAATLRIDASYNQLASFGPIISDQTKAATPQMRRKYPVQVMLKLDGPMLLPQINFDIVAKDLPQNINLDPPLTPVQLNFEFVAFKNKLDEQELKRQVFSLIVLRRFSPPDLFNTSGTLFNSVSELLSNQLSNWMSQVDENLEVNVDVGAMNQEAFNTFQLRLAYTFMNGRLRITRDGTFGNQYTNSTSVNSSSISSIAGDWTVDYLLTADGKFKVKMYNRANVNPITSSLGTQSAFTTGVSLTHTQSFNQIRDLLVKSREKRKKDEEATPDPNKEGTKEDGTD